MSVNYIDKLTGDLIRVAGQGKAEYGASTERKGDVVVPATTAGNFQSVSVVFAQAMPDNDYAVVIDEGGETWAHGATNVTNKTATGFTLFFYNAAGSDAPQMSFKYRAFKLYTDTEYNNLLNNVILKSDVTSVVTKGNMNPVKSNAVYDTLNASITDLTVGETAMTYEDYTVETLGAHMYQVGRLCWVHIDMRVTYTAEMALETDGHIDFWSNKFSIPDFDDVSEWNAVPCFGYVSNSHRTFEITLNNYGVVGGQKAIAFRIKYSEDEPIHTGDVFNLRCICCFAKK